MLTDYRWMDRNRQTTQERNACCWHWQALHYYGRQNTC